MSNLVVFTAYLGRFKLFGYIAILLGGVMNYLYEGMSAIGISNIGVAIIVLTVLIYTLMLPLTYKQQKFSRLSRKMSPELKALQEKYKDKRDQASQQAMLEEQREIYDKYGISPTGSCLQSFISILILLPLYRVIYNVPAYVSKVYNTFVPAVEGIMGTDGYKSTFDKLVSGFNISLSNLGVSDNSISSLSDAQIPKRIVDILYKCNPDNWASLADTFKDTDIAGVQNSFNEISSFLFMNITNSPRYTMLSAFSEGKWGLVILALLVPVIAGLTQFINLRLAPTAGSGNPDDPMASQMKMMNYMMPLMSVFFVFTLPFGLGIYWITGALIRSLYQVIFNKHFDKIDLDEIIEKNKEKAQKKKEKRGINIERLNRAATMSTRSIKSSDISDKERERLLSEASSIKENARPGSLAARANIVSEFNKGKKRKDDSPEGGEGE